MSSEHQHNGGEPEPEPLSESWREVGEQLQGLVSRVADVFRQAWSEERQFDHLVRSDRLEDELRISADRVDRVFRRVAAATESERSEAMETTRQAGERTLGEIKVVAAKGLRALNEQLDDLAKSLEQERARRRAQEQPEHTPDGDTGKNGTSGHE